MKVASTVRRGERGILKLGATLPTQLFTAAAKAQAAADWMHARQPTTAAGRAEDVAQARAA